MGSKFVLTTIKWCPMTGVKSLSFSCLIGAILVVAPTPASFAFSCDTKPMELAFDHSTHVFLGRILSSQITYSADEQRSRHASGVRHQFEVIESFKGDVDYATFETELAWSSKTAHFAVGDINLFFMGKNPGFDSCTPKYLLGQEDTAIVLQKLRDLKKGVFNTFSGAWATAVSDGHCSIYTTYLLEGSLSTVSFSIGHFVATDSKRANSNVWIYSYSKTGERTIDRSGLTLTYENGTIAIPYANSLLDNGANFYSKLDRVDRLLSAVLAQEPVYLEGSTRSNAHIEIPLLLNGGSEAIKEFAHCGKLQLGDED